MTLCVALAATDAGVSYAVPLLVAAPTVTGMTRPEAAEAAASWQKLTDALRRLSDEEFAALSPASLDTVEVPVRVRFGVRSRRVKGEPAVVAVCSQLTG